MITKPSVTRTAPAALKRFPDFPPRNRYLPTHREALERSESADRLIVEERQRADRRIAQERQRADRAMEEVRRLRQQLEDS